MKKLDFSADGRSDKLEYNLFYFMLYLVVITNYVFYSSIKKNAEWILVKSGSLTRPRKCRQESGSAKALHIDHEVILFLSNGLQ